MGTGFLKITTTAGNGAEPVANASYIIKNKSGQILFSGMTDANGDSPTYTLEAPSEENSQSPSTGRSTYGLCDISIRQNDYQSIDKIDVQIYDGVTTVMAFNLEPYVEGQDDADQSFVTPPPGVTLPTTQYGQVGTDGGFTPEQNGRVLSSVVVPDYITVHLGTPSSNAANIRVPFQDYIKNVVCSEIYPTWPTNALLANIAAIVTFALNRIYTEWYRSRGYNFDITNSTIYDMAYVRNREIYKNISELVDGVFTVYAHRDSFRNPYFTEFCNGTTATCNGLSQWGTVPLANQGLSVLEILRYYYPNDLVLSNAPTGSVQNSYPGSPLRLGASGIDVRRMQTFLNRIHRNYPLIPTIAPVDGNFGTQTQESVRVFQRTFNLTADGIVGVSTWNKISQIYAAVTGLAELNAEGEFIGIGNVPPTSILRQGSRGDDVLKLQFLLNYIAQFYSSVQTVTQDSVFGSVTANSVRSFQRQFGLSADGVVGQNTWNKLYQVYRTLQGDEGIDDGGNNNPWPGVYLRQGSTGSNVVALQNLLNNARSTYAQIPYVTVDGIFGAGTDNAVRIFQRAAGLTVDGIVGPATWNALVVLG